MRRAQTAIHRFDSLRIVGPGWSGNSRQGFQFNPASGLAGAAPGGAPVPSITGACCPESGSCFISTQIVCVDGGGTYQGDNTTCTPDPCPSTFTGACCGGDGSCAITTQVLCEDGDGVYQGDGTTCEEVDCGHGACCYSGVGCVFQTFLECFENGGSFQGFGILCSPNPCPGICCTDCVSNPSDPGCALTLEADCTGTWHETATDCGPCLTTCCFHGAPDPHDPCCQRITLSDCISGGGTAEGVCIPCEDIICTCP